MSVLPPFLRVYVDEGLAGEEGQADKPVSRKRVQRLMRTAGLRAIYRPPGTNGRSLKHRVYSCLLRDAGAALPMERDEYCSSFEEEWGVGPTDWRGLGKWLDGDRVLLEGRLDWRSLIYWTLG